VTLPKIMKEGGKYGVAMVRTVGKSSHSGTSWRASEAEERNTFTKVVHRSSFLRQAASCGLVLSCA
jgi:hypothetical protein